MEKIQDSEVFKALVAYIQHVVANEGTHFLSDFEEKTFAKEDWEILKSARDVAFLGQNQQTL